MRLYSYYRSSASYRVRIALSLKAIAYEYVAVDISPKAYAQDAESYRTINPLRQVPVLEWRDAAGDLQRLTQSVAIVEYLDEHWPDPPLFPPEGLMRARVREAVEIVNAGVQPLQNVRTLAALRAAGGLAAEERFRHEAIARGLDALERLAAIYDGPYFCGAQPTAADIFILPQLYNARRFSVPVPEGSRLSQIEQHALTQEPFVRAHPDNQPDSPASERNLPCA